MKKPAKKDTMKPIRRFYRDMQKLMNEPDSGINAITITAGGQTVTIFPKPAKEVDMNASAIKRGNR